MSDSQALLLLESVAPGPDELTAAHIAYGASLELLTLCLGMR